MFETILFIAFALPGISSGSDWEQLEDTGYSVMEINLHSISSSGALTHVDVREVFSLPEHMDSGTEYDLRVIHMAVKCAEDTTAIEQITYYLNGLPVQTMTVPADRLEFLSMAADPAFSHMVCAAKKS